MKAARIFVEGKADKKFIEDFVTHVFGEKPDDVRFLGGFSIEGIRNAKPQFDSGKTNLLIVDADYEENGGSFDVRKAEIDAVKAELNISFELFLLPNHNANGDLEALLCEIINPNCSDIFACWNGYEECLNNKNKGYTTPATKTKVYGYLEALLGTAKSDKEKIKEDKREYLNTAHWDLNSNAGNALRQFLISHLS